MTWTTGLAIYFVLWWLSLFLVLPWGVQTQSDADDVVPGSEAGAPMHPLIPRKLVGTTLLAGVFFVIYAWITTRSGLALDDIPWLPHF